MLTATITIGVFGLFHPHALEIETWGASRIEISCAGERVLEGSTKLRIAGECRAYGLNGAPVDFVLSVPGRIRRHYRGTLKIARLASGELVPMVTMALELAVASTTAAEAPSGASAAMLEAQAIVTRSYFTAGHGRHRAFDFCDTTHCQFLKDPPDAESVAARAVSETAGRVLVYRDRIVEALYAARCDGLLAPLPGTLASAGYPYFAVKCGYCSRHPPRVAAKANARPHHHGMCQLGAEDLAKRGFSATRILEHYYPGAEIR